MGRPRVLRPQLRRDSLGGRGRPVLARSLAATSALIILSQPCLGQDGRRCWAAEDAPAGAGALWPGLSHAALQDPTQLTVDRFIPRIVGRYVLLEVMTEGAGLGKSVVESSIEIRARPDTSTPWAGARPRSGPQWIIEARGVVDRLGYLHDSLKPPPPERRSRYLRGQYRSPNDLVLVEMDPEVPHGAIILDDPSSNLRVTEIDSTGTLMGRWTSGGYVVIEYETPVGKLAEHAGGYFCAWRLPDHGAPLPPN